MLLHRLLCHFIIRRMISLLLVLPSITVSATEIQTNTAVLRWLDKVVARVSSLEIPVGQTLRIEGSALRVAALICVTRPPSETPESAAFLEVWEVKVDEPAVNVFRGWMFASSPALSAMEHPVYDLWLLSCRDNP